MAALVVGCGCAPPCEAGRDLYSHSSFVKNLRRPSPISFSIGAGTCERARDIPVPSVKVVAEDGSISGGSVVWEQPDLPLGGAPSDHVRGRAHARLHIDLPQAGRNEVELAIRDARYSFEITYVDAIALSPQREVDRDCHPPVRISSDALACNVQLDGADAGLRAFESREGIVTLLGPGSRLWHSTRGYLLSDGTGIGWLDADQPLEQWSPTLVLPGVPVAVSATSQNVFVVIENDLLVLGPDLESVAYRIEVGEALGPWPTLTSSEAGLVLVGETLSFSIWGKAFRRFYRFDGNEWRSLRREQDEYWVSAVAGKYYWTCNRKDNVLKLYQVDENPDNGLLASTSTLGECVPQLMGATPVLRGDGFSQCAVPLGDRIGFVSLDSRSLDVTCFGTRALVRTGFPAPHTQVIDLSPHLPE
jgi:hypothetical protein